MKQNDTHAFYMYEYLNIVFEKKKKRGKVLVFFDHNGCIVIILCRINILKGIVIFCVEIT